MINHPNRSKVARGAARDASAAWAAGELFNLIPDPEAARAYLEARLWPEGPRCPVCGMGEVTMRKRDGFYRCNQCKEDFTVRTGTIFERSHIPLHKWIYAMYLLLTARKGISSLQLSKEIGVTQKSAWFMLHRIREACGDDLEKLQGIVEVAHHTLARLDSLVDAVVGKRLTYKALIA